MTAEDPSVAEVKSEGGKIFIKGLKAGQTNAVIVGDKTQEFVITVRESAGNTGWL